MTRNELICQFQRSSADAAAKAMRERDRMIEAERFFGREAEVAEAHKMALRFQTLAASEAYIARAMLLDDPMA